MAILIVKNSGNKRKYLLIISIITTVLILFIFKYLNFFIINFDELSKLIGWNYSFETLKIILPLGLSFHTFQSLAYVVEVYKDRQKVEKNFGIYSLYVMFFPQLVAGPIERPQNLLHQFYEKHFFEYKRVVSGLRLILFGFFQKIVIADRLALIVNKVYDNPSQFPGYILVFATFLFAFQIFCDFAGYSYIAIGSARVLGFRLMKNFDNPYISSNITEFWNRWHISLYSWFRDYVYIPLGGSHKGRIRTLFNILIIFLISGLWHGANWTFVVWGGLNGLYIVFYNLTKNLQEKLFSKFEGLFSKNIILFIQIIITFLLVSFSWIFFRSKDLDQAFYIITHLSKDFNNFNFVLNLDSFNQIINTPNLTIIAMSFYDLILLFGAMLFMMIVLTIQSRGLIDKYFSSKPLVFRWVVYFCILLAIARYSSTIQSEFIYFQF